MVFVAAEECLDAGFGAARARLGNLLRSGALITSSVDCYEQGLTGPLRVDAPGSAPDAPKLVDVQFGEMVIRGDSARLPLRWRASGPGGGLFPALDADLTLTALGEDTTTLGLAGAYRPPPGKAGAALDRAAWQRVAAATIQAFIRHVADAVVHPVAAPARGREYRGLPPWQPPAPGTP